ncbi:MAG: NAD(P)/FAD-dependent oxidoreductase [Acidobacteriales bacterium]|nr:NAD(P)/FAD-dependent oxidoreductase [Terriglobales bacterium]
MSESRDIIILGGGHNGLVTAFYLAKAGFKPLVLEARGVVGGCAVTEELAPGFRCSTLAHSAGPLRADIVSDMQLESHGLKQIRPDVRVFAPAPDGRAILMYDDVERTAESIAKLSAKDATQYKEFSQVLARMATSLAPVMSATPPSVASPNTGDMLGLAKTALGVRRLGKKDLYRLLRWGPMAIADFVAEWFETDLLRAIIAARGIFGTFLGPWSAGSTTVYLLRATADTHPAGPSIFATGGIGAVTQAMAAAAIAAGAEVRVNAPVTEIIAKDGKVTGVRLQNGESIAAKAVVSSADPKRTLLGLLDPANLEPDFMMKLQNFRAVGTVAKVNLALSSLPRFTTATDENALKGRIHIGPEIDYLERAFDHAKYGEMPTHPYLEATIPSLSDASLAPAGKHVMSVYVQFCPFKLKNSDWDAQRNALGDLMVKTLEQYAPGISRLVEHRQVITPKDLQETYGLTGGHVFHGELALDQLFAMRPLLEYARYRTPVNGLYLCGNGTHPGAGLTGASGANAAREILKDLG